MINYVPASVGFQPTIAMSEITPSRHFGERRCLTRREPEGTHYRTSARALLSSASPPVSEAVAETRVPRHSHLFDDALEARRGEEQQRPGRLRRRLPPGV